MLFWDERDRPLGEKRDVSGETPKTTAGTAVLLKEDATRVFSGSHDRSAAVN
jgi:hypothetical protein